MRTDLRTHTRSLGSWPISRSFPASNTLVNMGFIVRYAVLWDNEKTYSFILLLFLIGLQVRFRLHPADTWASNFIRPGYPPRKT